MNFSASRSLVAFDASFTPPVFSLFVRKSKFFSRVLPLLRVSSIIPVVTRFLQLLQDSSSCYKIPPVVTRFLQLLQDSSSFPFLITWPKRVAWRLCILFISDFVSAPHDTISFDFFAVHEIVAFSAGTSASSFYSFFICFEIIHVSHPYI